MNAAFINLGAGYLVQQLPFTLFVKDFALNITQAVNPDPSRADLILKDGDHHIEQTHRRESPVNLSRATPSIRPALLMAAQN